jgi:NADH-quinone oxidoreductase subunit F
MVKAALQFSRFLSIESCGQCPPCKLASGDITTILERLEGDGGGPGDLDVMLARAISVTDGQKCALPTGESLLVQSLLQLFWPEFLEHGSGPCPRPRELRFPKLVDYDEEAGRFLYDERYARKRPDWTYAD